MRRVGFPRHIRRIRLQQPREIAVNLRVILADDHPFVLLGVRVALELHAGVTVVGEANTPTSLIKLLQSTPCDVLVTDLTMPEASGEVEDGLDLVRRIRSAWPLLRIVVMTALTNTAILRAIVSDGAISLLSKMETIGRALASDRGERQGEGLRRPLRQRSACPAPGRSVRSAAGLAFVPQAGRSYQNVGKWPFDRGDCDGARMSSPNRQPSKARSNGQTRRHQRSRSLCLYSCIRS